MTTFTKQLHPNFIEEVSTRIDIVDVVSQYVELKKRGKEYLGSCPFHGEKTPSFNVSPDKRLAYCFGCTWGGNAIKFLMELGKVSFTDAVLELARSVGVPIQYKDGSSEDFPEPLPRPAIAKPTVAEKDEPQKDYTVSEGRVQESTFRLLHYKGDAEKARAWLQNRGITRKMIERYRLGLEKRVVVPDESKPDRKETYWAITIFIPVPNRPGRFYIKKRVAPWLSGDQRPDYLGKWAQFGVPATVFFAYNPPDAQQTWHCEGEWDAIALGELARQRGEKVAIACSTAGAGSLPKQEELDRLPGEVTILFDRDEAGLKGAQKLEKALGDRARVALIPMPDNCSVKGWDVSNALDAGYTWEDFETAASSVVGIADYEQELDQKRQREVEDANQARTFNNFVTSQVSKRLKRLANWIKTREGQGEDATPIPSSNPFQGRLITPGDIPAPEVYGNEGAPLYLYRSGDMERIWQAARFKRGEKHYKAVLDVSLTGTGKSEIAGRQRTENWFLQKTNSEDNTNQKLLYFSQSGQNTTAPSLEGWTPLARMHNGLIERPGKLTGGGKPFIERPRAGETPTIPGNCWATSLQHLLAQKNIGHGGSQADKHGDSNPICNLCDERDNCKDGSPGARPSGFKGEMKEALAQPRLKGTLAGFPGEHDFQIVAFVDEAEATIQATRDVTASLTDIGKEFFRLWQYDKDLYDAFAFIQSTLSIYLSEEKPPKYGYDFATIKSWFAEKHLDGFEFEFAIRKLEAAANALSARELGMLRSNQSEDDVNTLVTLNWLIPFCQVVGGSQPGSARIVNNQLIVTVRNERELDLIRSFDFTVLLDATAERDEIARILGYEPWEILWVMQVPPNNPYANLRVGQVTGLGKCGKDRRDRTSRRIEATEQAIEDWALGKTPNPTLDALVGGRNAVFPNGVDPEKIAYLRHLKYYNAGELYYFGGNNGERGSNAAQDCQLLIMEGLPRENIGSALARYHALYGTDCGSDHPDFQAWYNRQIDKRIFQAIGRSRYTRRADQIIPVIILGDADLSGVTKHYGLSMQQIDAFHVAAEAGTPTQVNGWKIFGALKELTQEGSKVLQRQVGGLTNLAQSTISEFASLVGGWKPLIKISEVLFKQLYNSSDISGLPDLTEKERGILEEYIPVFLFLEIPPEDVAHELGDVVSVVGLDSFLRIVGAAPHHIQTRLLVLIMQVLPLDSINELTALTQGIP